MSGASADDRAAPLRFCGKSSRTMEERMKLTEKLRQRMFVGVAAMLTPAAVWAGGSCHNSTSQGGIPRSGCNGAGTYRSYNPNVASTCRLSPNYWAACKETNIPDTMREFYYDDSKCGGAPYASTPWGPGPGTTTANIYSC